MRGAGRPGGMGTSRCVLGMLGSCPPRMRLLCGRPEHYGNLAMWFLLLDLGEVKTVGPDAWI